MVMIFCSPRTEPVTRSQEKGPVQGVGIFRMFGLAKALHLEQTRLIPAYHQNP